MLPFFEGNEGCQSRRTWLSSRRLWPGMCQPAEFPPGHSSFGGDFGLLIFLPARETNLAFSSEMFFRFSSYLGDSQRAVNAWPGRMRDEAHIRRKDL